jgi:hypothetical protein
MPTGLVRLLLFWGIFLLGLVTIFLGFLVIGLIENGKGVPRVPLVLVELIQLVGILAVATIIPYLLWAITRGGTKAR